MSGLAPRAREDSVRPRRSSGVVVRPLNFTVSRRGDSVPQITRTLLAGAALLIQSCADQHIDNVASSDPKRVAVISADSELSSWLPGLVVVMKEVDGVTVAASTHRVTVAPGLHKLTVECKGAPATNTQFLEIDARPGARYQLSPSIGRSAYPCKAVVEEK